MQQTDKGEDRESQRGRGGGGREGRDRETDNDIGGKRKGGVVGVRGW